MEPAIVRPWSTIVIKDKILCDSYRDSNDLDTQKRISCFTHIHDDHISGLQDALGREFVLSTNETKELASALLKGDSDADWVRERTNYYGLGPGQKKSIDGTDVSFRKANHILGSAQLLVRGQNESVLYSSDFMLEGTDCEIDDVDYLILDSTHGEFSKRQEFESMVEGKKKIIGKAKQELSTGLRQLIIHANRGTMQKVMSWLRKEFDDDIPFLAPRIEKNIADVYTKSAFPCGNVEDWEEAGPAYVKLGHPFIRFLPINSIQQCQRVEPITPSIRIGASIASNLSQPEGMYVVNLQEHATVNEILDYLNEIKPKHIIIDNSIRVQNPANAESLCDILNKKKLGWNPSVELSPKIHPRANNG